MHPKRKQELKSRAQELKAELHLGKNALTDTVLAEVKKRLQLHGLVKIKFLDPVKEGRKELAHKIAEATLAELIEVKGNTAVLFRGKKALQAAARKP